MAEQNLKTFEKALKENYLPVWRNQINTEASALLATIKKVPLVSNEIVSAAPIGLSGGFGFGQEGEATPEAGNVNFERFKTYAKDMYCDLTISNKAVELTGSAGAMANALDVEVKAAYETAKWNVGRALFGNGSGILAKVTAQTEAGTSVQVDDVKYIKEGLICDFYATGATTKTGTYRIKAVNRVASAGKYTITLDKATTAALSAGFLTVQNSYNQEITGLGTIYDDNITSIYGVSKSDQPFLKPVVYDADNDISDGIITKTLREAEMVKNSKIDMLMMGNDAYDDYVTYLRENNIRVEDKTGQIQGGFKTIKFLFGNREVDIVNEQFIPSTETWGVDTTTLAFHNTDWKFLNLQNGGVFNLMENKSSYRALLASYGNVICSNPGGCVRITNC